MEPPLTRDTKKNTKIIPVTLTGAGSFGIGGIVLLGGGLVAATIVSVLAFKRRKQHQSSSEKITPRDGVTSLNGIETKTLQNLTKDEKHISGIGNEEEGDSNENVMYSLVGEGQENTSVYVDSVSENREVDDSYEKVVLESDEQVVMKGQIKEDSCLEGEDGGEEQKCSMMVDDEKDEVVDATMLLSDQTLPSIEEYEEIETPLRDDVAKASETEEEEDYEKIFMIEEAATEAGCVNQVKVNEREQFLEEDKEKDGQDETISENYVGEDVLEMADKEFGLDAQEVQVNKECETFVVPCNTDRLKEAVDDRISLEEDNSPIRLKNTEIKGKETTAYEVEEQAIIEDEVVNIGDMLLPQAQLIEGFKVDDQNQTVNVEDEPPRQLVNLEKEDVSHVTAVQVEDEMMTNDEVVEKERISKEDEIPHVKSIEEDVKVSSNTSSDELENSSMTTEPKISYQRTLNEVLNNSDKNGILKDDNRSKSASKLWIEVAKAKKQVQVTEPWNLKLMTWFLLVSIWCLCYWYSKLPYPELSLVGSLFFVLILLGYRNRTTYLV